MREALGVVATSALSEDRMAGIDKATDRIGHMLTDLISHPKSRGARHAVLSNGRTRDLDGDLKSAWRSSAQGFFVSRANRLVGATPTNEAWIGWELRGTNVRGSFLNDFFGIVELPGIARGDLGLVGL
jgi:hypothetical protein